MKTENQEKLINYLRSLIFRCMLLGIIFLLMAIGSKKSNIYKDYIIYNVYENNFSFSKVKKLYNKYLGNIMPNIFDNTSPVFNEELSYLSKEKYLDGVMLKVNNNYLVPSIENGMVSYIGEKEKYGNVIVVSSEDGVDIWYGNMNMTSVKLYDYIDKGNYLGEVKDDKLYLVYVKDNSFLDYNEYLK